MRHIIANTFNALLLLVFLVGCTTAPVSGAGDIGYKNIGSAGPNRLYVCTGSTCGNLSVVVHRTTSISQSEVTEYEDLVNSPEGRRIIKRELANVGRNRGNDVRLGPVSKTAIAGKIAAQFNMVFYENGKKDGSGHVILIVENGKLQIFAAINENGSRARTEVRQFAQKWAAGSK
jgi:hypothetical protein